MFRCSVFPHFLSCLFFFLNLPLYSTILKLHISKPSEASDDDEDEFYDSDEERHANKSLDGDTDAEEEDGQSEEPVMRFGVTPFLSGVLPAGKLRVRPKPVGCQAYGLIQVRLKDMPFSYNTINMVLLGVEPRNTSITFVFLPLQVNGKSYNQARLLLGNMGSLHPANRLAAYVTGRLHAPADISHKTSQISDPTNNINTPGTLHIKAAGTVVPPTITARKTTELKTLTQPPGKMVSQTPAQAHSFRLIAPQWREKSSTRDHRQLLQKIETIQGNKTTQMYCKSVNLVFNR